jgi:hypothetical protein
MTLAVYKDEERRPTEGPGTHWNRGFESHLGNGRMFVFALSCVGSGLAMSRGHPVQGV